MSKYSKFKKKAKGTLLTYGKKLDATLTPTKEGKSLRKKTFTSLKPSKKKSKLKFKMSDFKLY